MSVPNFVPHLMKISIISVTSYEDKILQGTISNPYFGEDQHFKGVVQLVLLLEKLQGELNYPEATMRPRSFFETRETAPSMNTVVPGRTETPLATFRICVYFKQNASCQGSEFWAEQNMDAGLRSVLELIILLDEVLSKISA